MPLHVLALGKHSLFIIKPLAESRKPLRLLPRLSRMLRAVATNWFPCLPFVKGRTQHIDALYQLLRNWEIKQQGGCLVSQQIDWQSFGYYRRLMSHISHLQ